MALTVAVERHLPTTALFSLHVYILGVHLSLDCQISRAVSPKQKLKINQLENILNLIGQGLCNSIWLREGPATFRRPSLNIFGARQGWPELKRVCKWAPLPLRGNQSTKKNNTPSDFRPPTRDGGDCYENSPVGLFRLKLLILENILQLWRKRMCFDRKRILFVFDQLWCRDNAVILLSLPAVNCLFQLPTVSSSSDERWWKCRSGRI